MKSLTNKIIAAIIIIIIAIAGIWAGNKFLYGAHKPDTSAQNNAVITQEKTLNVTIENQVDGKIIMENKVYKTTATTLEQFLEENKTDLKVDITTTKYGPFLNGLDGLNTPSMDKGPWWMYSFSSKDLGVDYKVGAAPAIDKVTLGKDSTITFVYTDKM
ncbi:MAG: hypothetical protein ACRC41_07820 [Sarcina sp.]